MIVKTGAARGSSVSNIFKKMKCVCLRYRQVYFISSLIFDTSDLAAGTVVGFKKAGLKRLYTKLARITKLTPPLTQIKHEEINIHRFFNLPSLF